MEKLLLVNAAVERVESKHRFAKTLSILRMRHVRAVVELVLQPEDAVDAFVGLFRKWTEAALFVLTKRNDVPEEYVRLTVWKMARYAVRNVSSCLTAVAWSKDIWKQAACSFPKDDRQS